MVYEYSSNREECCGCFELRCGVITIGVLLIVGVVLSAIMMLALFALLASLGEENDDFIN